MPRARSPRRQRSHSREGVARRRRQRGTVIAVGATRICCTRARCLALARVRRQRRTAWWQDGKVSHAELEARIQHVSEAEEALCAHSPSASRGSLAASARPSQRRVPRHDARASHNVHSHEAEYAKDPNFKSDVAEREVEMRVRPRHQCSAAPCAVRSGSGRVLYRTPRASPDSDSGARRMTLR